MKRIWNLGSTGSIGTQALQVVEACPGRFSVVGVSAHRNAAAAAEQAKRYGAKFLALTGDADSAAAEKILRGTRIELLQGPQALLSVLREGKYDTVLQAITGAAGLPYSLEALRAGKVLALANKESLVVAGELLVREAKAHGATILPVDSEHSAIFQCLRGENARDVRRVFLTGSGGPFRTRPLDAFASITPEEALQHPNWKMGPRITVGSATMMNKVFEVIEAHHLFGLAPEQIQVLIHPQSIVHSMVEFVDGSIVAQMGLPDMRIPIHYALSFPERAQTPFPGFDPTRFRELHFELPLAERFPALALGERVIRQGGVSGAVLNAADEVATQRFLDRQIDFPQIVTHVESVLARHRRIAEPAWDDFLAADAWARKQSQRTVTVSS